MKQLQTMPMHEAARYDGLCSEDLAALNKLSLSTCNVFPQGYTPRRTLKDGGIAIRAYHVAEAGVPVRRILLVQKPYGDRFWVEAEL